MSAVTDSNTTRFKRKRATPPGPDLDAKFWRLPAVMAFCQRSRSAIYADPSFPRPIAIGPRTAAWESAAVRRWCDERIAAARERAS